MYIFLVRPTGAGQKYKQRRKIVIFSSSYDAIIKSLISSHFFRNPLFDVVLYYYFFDVVF